MADRIVVSPEQLAAVAGQLNAGASSIEGTLGQLRANVAPLGSEWAGVAQVRFMQLFEQWQTSSRQLQQSLTEISRLMQQASGQFVESDQSIAHLFGR